MSRHRERRLTAISLYSGAGGLDYGFEAAGFETTVAVEVDPTCCQTLRTNRNWSVIENDILKVSTPELLAVAGLRVGEVDILIGGPPCQPFSKSGYWVRGDAKRLDDPRATTLHAFMRVLGEALPKAFLLENVPGLAFDGKDEGLQLLMELLARINRREGTSYRAHVRQLSAADFGVPQIRQRVFVVGSRNGRPFTFPAPTHAAPEELESLINGTAIEPHRTAWDAIGDVEPDGAHSLSMTGKWARLLPSIPEGQNYLFHTERGGGLPLFGWRRRYWSFLLKLAKNRPSWTIQAQPGPSTGPFHWDNRRLSMRELCRLQTFPDNVRISGDLRAVQKQLGNAVPSLLAEVLARQIRVQLLDVSDCQSPLRLLPPRRLRCPPPSAPKAVPEEYRRLVGKHEAHPGTGRGFRAQINLPERSDQRDLF